MELAIAHRTTKSFSESDDVVDLQLKKTTAFLELQVDVRRGVEWQAMLLQPDAQQVRAARQPLRLRLTWTRFHEAADEAAQRRCLPPRSSFVVVGL